MSRPTRIQHFVFLRVPEHVDNCYCESLAYFWVRSVVVISSCRISANLIPALRFLRSFVLWNMYVHNYFAKVLFESGFSFIFRLFKFFVYVLLSLDVVSPVRTFVLTRRFSLGLEFPFLCCLAMRVAFRSLAGIKAQQAEFRFGFDPETVGSKHSIVRQPSCSSVGLTTAG